jgi:tetratricopeptide (TPR) repeat protein
MLASALESLGAADSAEAAELGLQLAWDHLYRCEYLAAAGRAGAARRVAERLGSRPLAAATAGVHALTEFNLGHLAVAEAAFAEGCATVGELGDEELAGRLDALVLLGFGAYFLDRLETGIALLERGIDISRTSQEGHLYVPMLLLLALIRVARGDLEAANRLALDAEDVARLSNNPQSLTWSLTVQCATATLSGELALALRRGEDAVALGGRLTQHYFSMLARCYLAVARLEDGDPEGCIRELLAITGDPDLPRSSDPFARRRTRPSPERSWHVAGRKPRPRGRAGRPSPPRTSACPASVGRRCARRPRSPSHAASRWSRRISREPPSPSWRTPGERWTSLAATYSRGPR